MLHEHHDVPTCRHVQRAGTTPVTDPEPAASVLLGGRSGCPCAAAQLMELGRCLVGKHQERAVLLSYGNGLAAALGTAREGNRFEQQKGGSRDPGSSECVAGGGGMGKDRAGRSGRAVCMG